MKKLTMIAVFLFASSAAMAGLADVEPLRFDIRDPDHVILMNAGDHDITFDGFDLKGPAGSITDFQGGYVPPMDFLLKGFAVLANTDSLFGFASLSQSMTMSPGQSYDMGPLVTSDNCRLYSVLIADAANVMGYGDVYTISLCIPEPASMSLLALGALPLLRRRR